MEPSANGVVVEAVTVLYPWPVVGTTVPATAKLLITNNMLAAEIDVLRIFIAYISFLVIKYKHKREKSKCQSGEIEPSTGIHKLLIPYPHLRGENLVRRLG